MKPILMISDIKKNVSLFFDKYNEFGISSLYGVDNGKTVGTYVEDLFNDFLRVNFTYEEGNRAKGIDFPELLVDLKTTSSRQPQSSCPFRSPEQKIYGLGYHLLIFVYDKQDDQEEKVARLQFQNGVFINKEQTGDYQTTRGILEILERDGNVDDIAAFLEDRNLPLDDMSRFELAESIVTTPPKQGYLTISNALQWRLQYGRVIELANTGNTLGVENMVAER